MKRFIALAIALSLAPLVSAQLYKYVDKDGKTVYSDQPPANTDSKQLNVQTGTSSPTTVPKTAVERDKELQKGREEATKKAADAQKAADLKDAQCEAAKQTYAQYANGGRMQRTLPNGEREMLSDEEIDAGREKAQKQMDAVCNK
jgi:hypothetical protein